MILRLLLGDQLNSNHSWFQEKDDKYLYFMAEMRQETDYVVHHIQKIAGFFLAMRNFSESIKEQGHKVIYWTLDEEENTQSLTENLQKIFKEQDITQFEYQYPDEYRLDQQLKEFCKKINIPSEAYDTEHFYTQREDLASFFKGKKQIVMEYFYRDMRKKHHILMVNDKDPEGGKWNYDKSNRKKWKGTPAIPERELIKNDVSEIVKMIQERNVKTFGNIEVDAFPWPTSRKESLQLLDYFCDHLLVNFGDFQDAMDPNEKFLFHSKLSFSLNIKMITPMEVIDQVIDTWKNNKESIDISQVEGFVRQILGWREFMRGMYWKEMPEYASKNELNCKNPLPDFYWTGDTQMNCLKHAISQSLDNAYAHHIQRLMITGNYALLTQTDPDEVDDWYLGIYIDALQWVEITNTRGMSQWADGGLIATKPYVSSGSYINKMSNYCKDCHYKVSKKTGEDACPFNALYWNFIDEKQDYFKDNQRMSMMLSLLHKMDKDLLQEYKERAQHIIENPNEY
ncbi:MAG: cryptochrome/photolyase family protein [Flavobacteriaceae bacterium]|nr:cryptochrome/photolyase family protein [Flavobacteriaceae bacterium]|tara:strand:+ start:103717 stop:105249 length:1533 start_codon:yes stop_codon:yes gene_type:complete